MSSSGCEDLSDILFIREKHEQSFKIIRGFEISSIRRLLNSNPSGVQNADFTVISRIKCFEVVKMRMF